MANRKREIEFPSSAFSSVKSVSINSPCIALLIIIIDDIQANGWEN
jgi:hypothetical protein